MTRVSASAFLRRGRRLLPGPLALAAALAAWAAPAAAQTPCAGPGWAEHNVIDYHFAWLSRQRGGSAVNCVRNNHARRGVFVDWQGAGLRSFIPPGRTIFRTSPLAGRAASPRPSRLFYGARPNLLTVPTVASLDPLLPRLDGVPARALFRRLALWQPDAADLAAEGSTALVYVPVGPDFYSARIDRTSHAGLAEWLESRPDRLGPFAMTFDNRVAADAQGRLNVAWNCRYRVTGLPQVRETLLYLRFSDPDLHRRMFGSAAPEPIDGWQGAEAVFSAVLPPLAPRRVESRTAQLLVLLDDRRTVIASIPVTYSAPRS